MDRNQKIWDQTCSAQQYVWATKKCTLQLQVHLNGLVALLDDTKGIKFTPYGDRFALNSKNLFRVRWADGRWPVAAVGCGGCTPGDDDTCICKVGVDTTAVFTASTGLPATVEGIRARLFIGAADPASFAEGVYALCTAPACASPAEVRVYIKTGRDGIDEETIIKLPSALPGLAPVFLINKASTVTTGTGGVYSFRNPPAFNRLAGEATASSKWQPDLFQVPAAEVEVEALIDHLFQHDNTAPFVAYRLIQRLVTSNPSPRYVRAAVLARTRFSLC